jgi:hypothetical protein
MFSGGVDSDTLLEAVKSRDEDALTMYMTQHPTCGPLLLCSILFLSHQTPYSHTPPAHQLALLKQYCEPEQVVATVERFWELRPATATVLTLKYVDWGVCELVDLVRWVLRQDGWMHCAWGWEVMTQVHEKASAPPLAPTEQDETNGKMEVERNVPREVLQTVVSGVLECYERQSEVDKEWLKEWFDMIIRLFLPEVDSVSAEGWPAESFLPAKQYKLRYLQ